MRGRHTSMKLSLTAQGQRFLLNTCTVVMWGQEFWRWQGFGFWHDMLIGRAWDVVDGKTFVGWMFQRVYVPCSMCTSYLHRCHITGVQFNNWLNEGSIKVQIYCIIYCFSPPCICCRITLLSYLCHFKIICHAKSKIPIINPWHFLLLLFFLTIWWNYHIPFFHMLKKWM